MTEQLSSPKSVLSSHRLFRALWIAVLNLFILRKIHHCFTFYSRVFIKKGVEKKYMNNKKQVLGIIMLQLYVAIRKKTSIFIQNY